MLLELPRDIFIPVNKRMPNIYIQCSDRDKRHEVLSSIYANNRTVMDIKFYHDYDYKSLRELEEVRTRFPKLKEFIRNREIRMHDGVNLSAEPVLVIADYIRTEDMSVILKYSYTLHVHWIISDYLVDTPYLDTCPMMFVIPPYEDYCKIPNRTIITLT